MLLVVATAAKLENGGLEKRTAVIVGKHLGPTQRTHDFSRRDDPTETQTGEEPLGERSQI